jgi:hypothetical protein
VTTPRKDDPMDAKTLEHFVPWFRAAAPYIHAFRGRTFVIAFGGEVVADGKFVGLTHDFNLLAALGVRLVLIHGARPQIDERLERRQADIRYVHDMRVTDEATLCDVAGCAPRSRRCSPWVCRTRRWRTPTSGYRAAISSWPGPWE